MSGGFGYAGNKDDLLKPGEMICSSEINEIKEAVEQQSERMLKLMVSKAGMSESLLNPAKLFMLDPKQNDETYFTAKKDEGKLRMDLIPPEAIEAIADVLTYGLQKYGEYTWQNVPDGKQRYKAALLRHYAEYAKGNTFDLESGKPHTAHMMVNAMFLNWLEKHDVVR